MVESAVKEKTDISQPDALTLADQAVHLLRRRGGPALGAYLVGTLPFLLGLLYFWSDMSRSADARWHCGPAAAGVALLFIWMKLWHVRYCRRLWCALQDTTPEKWPLGRSLSTAARQTLLHTTGLVLLPLSLLLPFAWVYAFYQNLSVLDGPDTKALGALYREASRHALLLPGQNHLLITLVSGFGFFVWLNAAAGLMLLPYLLKMLLGIETAFTISGYHAVFNTTFLAIATALTYLCVDPVIKAAYALRCFYGHSRRTGDDLRSDLKPFLLTALLTVLLWAAPGTWAQAPDASTPPGPPAGTVTENRAENLDSAIDRVLSQRRFAWRMPREVQEEPERVGWLWDTLRWLRDKVDAAFKTVNSWIDKLLEWMRKLQPEGTTMPSGEKRNWDPVIKIAFYAVGAALVVLLLLTIRNRMRTRRMVRREAPRDTGVDDIDLNDETITADALPRERWLAMAREMMAKGESRAALRAYYLAILSQLGDRGRIAIARYKSNRDYLGELSRRSHAEPELLDLFSRCMTSFERAWYGMHPVAQPQLQQFVSDQERISLIADPKAPA